VDDPGDNLRTVALLIVVPPGSRDCDTTAKIPQNKQDLLAIYTDAMVCVDLNTKWSKKFKLLCSYGSIKQSIALPGAVARVWFNLSATAAPLRSDCFVLMFSWFTCYDWPQASEQPWPDTPPLPLPPQWLPLSSRFSWHAISQASVLQIETYIPIQMWLATYLSTDKPSCCEVSISTTVLKQLLCKQDGSCIAPSRYPRCSGIQCESAAYGNFD
jgi:hypothetical protein